MLKQAAIVQVKQERDLFSAADTVTGLPVETLLKKLKPVDGEAETERETKVDGQKFKRIFCPPAPPPPPLEIFPMTTGT